MLYTREVVLRIYIWLFDFIFIYTKDSPLLLPVTRAQPAGSLGHFRVGWFSHHAGCPAQSSLSSLSPSPSYPPAWWRWVAAEVWPQCNWRCIIVEVLAEMFLVVFSGRPVRFLSFRDYGWACLRELQFLLPWVLCPLRIRAVVAINMAAAQHRSCSISPGLLLPIWIHPRLCALFTTVYTRFILVLYLFYGTLSKSLRKKLEFICSGTKHS